MRATDIKSPTIETASRLTHQSHCRGKRQVGRWQSAIMGKKSATEGTWELEHQKKKRDAQDGTSKSITGKCSKELEDHNQSNHPCLERKVGRIRIDPKIGSARALVEDSDPPDTPLISLGRKPVWEKEWGVRHGWRHG